MNLFLLKEGFKNYQAKISVQKTDQSQFRGCRVGKWSKRKIIDYIFFCFFKKITSVISKSIAKKKIWKIPVKGAKFQLWLVTYPCCLPILLFWYVTLAPKILSFFSYKLPSFTILHHMQSHNMHLHVTWCRNKEHTRCLHVITINFKYLLQVIWKYSR